MSNARLRLYTITALMIAISVVLPVFMPIIDVLGWTGTLASHVPVFLSMFIAPFMPFFTGLGSAVAFFLKTGRMEVVVRAATHIVFIAGGYAIYKGFGGKKLLHYIILMLGLGVVHAGLETLVGYLFLTSRAMADLFKVYFCGTFIHHSIDAAITWVIYLSLSKAKLMPRLTVSWRNK